MEVFCIAYYIVNYVISAVILPYDVNLYLRITSISDCLQYEVKLTFFDKIFNIPWPTSNNMYMLQSM